MNIANSEEAQLDCIRKNPRSIREFDNPHKSVQIEAVRQQYNCILMIDNPCEEALLIAAQQYPFIIKYLDNECIYFSDNVIYEALKYSGCAIAYVKNPNYKMMEMAIENDPISIRFFTKSPPEELLLKALDLNWNDTYGFICGEGQCENKSEYFKKELKKLKIKQCSGG